MAHELTDSSRIFLSTLPAGRSERRLALTVVLISIAIFAAAAPLAKVPLAQIPAFIPIYQSALVINDLLTAVLLFGQFSIMRSRALLMLAAGYVFSALMAVAHLLSFPGLFSPGLLGSGPQTTAWLYFLWHGGFPLFVIGYALSRGDIGKLQVSPRAAIVSSVAAVLGAACALVLFTTAGHDFLPQIMRGDADDHSKIIVAAGTWLLSLIALVVLLRRRSHSVLDLWLMVVMCVWIFDVALASVLNHGRYDLGWYAGRVYGLLAASFVLIVLLFENSMLYARLAEAHENERRERERAEQKTAELSAVNKELESFSYSVSHDLRSPLRAISGYSQILEEDHAAKLDAEGLRVLRTVRENAAKMGTLIEDLLTFSRLGRKPLAEVEVDMDGLVTEVVRELQPEPADQRTAIEAAKLPPAKGDRAMLRQVWVNLLSNAIKFSGKSEQPKVEIGATREGAQDIYWVRDSGVGFDMKYYEKLFGVFQRLHSAEEFPGTGVGLAIVQRIVTRHGGQVWANSKTGEGATFYFTLQRA